MNYRLKLVFLKITLPVIIVLFGFKVYGAAYTDYYYYNDQPYHLIQVPDQVFIELNDNISETSFNNLLLQFPELNDNNSFDVQDKRDFVFVNANINGDDYNNLIKRLIERPEVANASPVFRMPEGTGNDNTLIGVEDEIIVQFKPSVSDVEINSYLDQNGLMVIEELSLSGGSSYVLSIPQGGYSIDYANDLYLTGLVNYSEPNLFFTNLLQATDPNDPFFSMQWSHRNTGNNIPGGVTGVPGCDMRTDSAWIYTMGDPSVVVSMVDTGIDTLHEDLADRIIHGISINTYSNLPYAWDDNNHGTSTAGIVAATGNNNLGVIGVAPLSRLYGVKIFNSAGNTNSTAIVNGMIAAWQRGAWISSNSWGGGSPITAADNAIDDGVNMGRNGKGVVWCFATGNSNASSISWPSTNVNVISVGGVSPCNQRKSTSSCDGESWWGAQYGTGLEIVSPSVKIYTTDRTGSVGYTTGNYVSDFNGTSSATPNCSGVCALVLAVDSTLTWDVVRERICSTADKVGSYVYNQQGQLNLGGWNNEMGYGKINAYKVVKLTVESIPVELTSFTANVVNDKVELKWNTATETNNQGFDVERKSSSGSYEKIGFVSGFGTTTESKVYSFTDENVNAGTYTYKLKQVDYDGTFKYSNEISVEVSQPIEYSLDQNYPNPFNPSTTIKYSIPEDGFVKIAVYNLLGEEVTTLFNNVQKAGRYEVEFNVSSLSSGVYIYRIETTNFTSSKKLMLMK